MDAKEKLDDIIRQLQVLSGMREISVAFSAAPRRFLFVVDVGNVVHYALSGGLDVLCGQDVSKAYPRETWGPISDSGRLVCDLCYAERRGMERGRGQ